MTAVQTGWDHFRDDVVAEINIGGPDQLARLTWNSDRTHETQRDGLQALLSHAVEHSPFHRRRLAPIDLTDVDPADLSALPVMTKSKMMGALDEVFTDRRLNRRDIESAVAATSGYPVPILDDFVALASGGCSGHRGLFVLDRAATTSFASAIARPPAAAVPSPTVQPVMPHIAMVAATSAVHATGFIPALTACDGAPAHCRPGARHPADRRDRCPSERIATPDPGRVRHNSRSARSGSTRRSSADHPDASELHQRDPPARDALGDP